MGKKIDTLRVKLDKPFYVAGEEVTGVLYLAISSDLELEEIYVKAKGKELVQWDEMNGGTKESYDEKEGFFKKKIRFSCRCSILVAFVASAHVQNVWLSATGAMCRSRTLAKHEVLKKGKYSFPFSFTLPSQGQKKGVLTGPQSIGDSSNAASYNQDADQIRWKGQDAKSEVTHFKVRTYACAPLHFVLFTFPACVVGYGGVFIKVLRWHHGGNEG